MIRTIRGTVLLCACAALTGCVTTGDEPLEVNEEDAAIYNTQLGASYLQRGDLELAREKLEKAVKQDRNLASAHAYLGVVYERLAEPDMADKAYRTAVRLTPKDPSIVNTYGGYLCRSDRREEGIEYFLKAAENPIYRTPEVAFTNAGVCAAAIPDTEAAETYLKSALAANPVHREALIQLASLNMQRGDPMKTRAFIERFLDAGPATADALALAVRAETELGDQEAADAYQRQLEDEFPEATGNR